MCHDAEAHTIGRGHDPSVMCISPAVADVSACSAACQPQQQKQQQQQLQWSGLWAAVAVVVAIAASAAWSTTTVHASVGFGESGALSSHGSHTPFASTHGPRITWVRPDAWSRRPASNQHSCLCISRSRKCSRREARQSTKCGREACSCRQACQTVL